MKREKRSYKKCRQIWRMNLRIYKISFNAYNVPFLKYCTPTLSILAVNERANEGNRKIYNFF